MAETKRRDDHEAGGEGRGAWSSPRPTPGALGAAHDEVFGTPSSQRTAPDEDVESDEDADEAEADAAAQEEGTDAADPGATDAPARGDESRSVRDGETDVEGRSGATDPDGDGSRAGAPSSRTDERR